MLAENSRPVSGPWEHVLLVTSSEQNKGLPIDLETIQSSLSSALSTARVDICSPRIDAMRKALSKQSYQMVCFLGHGDLEGISNQGRLFFEDQAGKPLPLNGAQVAALLKGATSLQLVLLLACQSGRRIASKLVLDGIPAVVAMQFPISDRAANAFVLGFAAALAAGAMIPEATAKGRLAIRTEGFAMEWGTPACYLPRTSSQPLPWTEQIEEWIYEFLTLQNDLFSQNGLTRLGKAIPFLFFQRCLWLPWNNLPNTPVLPAALSLSAGCIVLPPLLTLLTRLPKNEPFFAHHPPSAQRLLRLYQITGAYLGYIIGLAADFVLLAIPFYYLGLGQILPESISALAWWIASAIPLLMAYTGLRRISRSNSAAYSTLNWSRNDTIILLGIPLIVVPALAIGLIALAPIWFNRLIAPWILGIAGALALGLLILQGREKKLNP